MKKLFFQLMLIAGLIGLGTTGCSNKEIDTAKLQTAFQSADSEVRGYLDNGVAAINAGKFADALPELRHVAFVAKMSKEQRLILSDTIKKVEAKAK
jgi:hypothetical protein